MYFTLLSKKDLTPSIKSYTFNTDVPLDFKPGQFVMLKQVGAPQKYARAFSFASAPTNTKAVFLMKDIPGGHISGYLAAAPIGSQLESSSPVGRFLLNPADIDRIFIATGTGIAPIISFLESESEQKIPAHVLFGVRSENDLFWTEKLPPDAHITLSQPSKSWNGFSGRVTTHIPELITQHPHAAWYICGNPEMVKEIRAQLLASHTDPSNIHFEIY